ncbi:hypothetical protein [Corynebacterium variabile]
MSEAESKEAAEESAASASASEVSAAYSEKCTKTSRSYNDTAWTARSDAIAAKKEALAAQAAAETAQAKAEEHAGSAADSCSQAQDAATNAASDVRQELEGIKSDTQSAASAASTSAGQSADSAEQARLSAESAAEVVSSGVPDATPTIKGKMKLAGDLAGSADAPMVPGLAQRAPLSHTHSIGHITGLQPVVDDVNAATYQAAAGQLIRRGEDGTASIATPTGSTNIANKGYVDSSVSQAVSGKATTAYVDAAVTDRTPHAVVVESMDDVETIDPGTIYLVTGA